MLSSATGLVLHNHDRKTRSAGARPAPPRSSIHATLWPRRAIVVALVAVGLGGTEDGGRRRNGVREDVTPHVAILVADRAWTRPPTTGHARQRVALDCVPPLCLQLTLPLQPLLPCHATPFPCTPLRSPPLPLSSLLRMHVRLPQGGRGGGRGMFGWKEEPRAAAEEQ